MRLSHIAMQKQKLGKNFSFGGKNKIVTHAHTHVHKKSEKGESAAQLTVSGFKRQKAVCMAIDLQYDIYKSDVATRVGTTKRLIMSRAAPNEVK